MIDAHFHIWRQADLPWLTGPTQPRIVRLSPFCRRPGRPRFWRAEILAGTACRIDKLR